MNDDKTTSDSRYKVAAFLCVVVCAMPAHTAPPDARFTKSAGNGEITDSVTGLVWEGSDRIVNAQWTDLDPINSWCSPYRVPTVEELTSVTDARIASSSTVAAADPIFGFSPTSYWTKESSSTQSKAWRVMFDISGAATLLDWSTEARVRCVR